MFEPSYKRWKQRKHQPSYWGAVKANKWTSLGYGLLLASVPQFSFELEPQTVLWHATVISGMSALLGSQFGNPTYRAMQKIHYDVQRAEKPADAVAKNYGEERPYCIRVGVREQCKREGLENLIAMVNPSGNSSSLQGICKELDANT